MKISIANSVTLPTPSGGWYKTSAEVTIDTALDVPELIAETRSLGQNPDQLWCDAGKTTFNMDALAFVVSHRVEKILDQEYAKVANKPKQFFYIP